MKFFKKLGASIVTGGSSSGEEMKLHPITLRFRGNQSHLEEEFQNDYFRKSLVPLRFALALALIFYGLFALVDAVLIPELKGTLWFIRFGIITPAIIAVMAFTYFPVFKRYMQRTIAALMYLTGLGIILMIIFASTVGNYTYYAGLILIFIFGYTFIKARFIHATLAGWSIVLSYELAAILIAKTPPEVLFNNNSFFISANIIGMFICYSIENSTRRDFYISRLLTNEQEKVKAVNEALEKRVQERTAQLTKTNRELKKEIEMRKHYELEQTKLEAQLLQLQKIETIGTLAGGIAHDFNNILTPILGYTEMALEELTEESSLKYDIEQINSAAVRAKDLVNQILTFSRHVDVEKKPLHLHVVIKEILKLVRASFPSNIEIKQNLDPGCGTVLADATQIHQIIMNLSTNALHSMSGKGGVFEVSLKPVEINSKYSRTIANLEHGSYARIRVRDGGIGMTIETRERLFEPFFTNKEVGVGSGLGLSVVHGIVKSYNGAITVDSEPGKGATFDIYLPQYGKGSSRKRQPADKVIKGKEKILFVDDEEEITFMGKKMLESLGYTVDIKTDSLVALEEFRSDPDNYDLLVTDQTMPNMVGTELVKKLREIRPDLKVIIITGYSDSISNEMVEKEGINQLIIKPLILSDFSKIIRRVLDNKKVRV
ncbi:MAG: response regulator [Bacteroidales bacterium]|nr:MAG: response regulator [Bacteroidales bacterium]